MTTDDRPWLSSYAPGVPADVPEPDEPVTRTLERSVAAFPDRVALDFLGKATTYAALAGEVDSSVDADDRVTLVLHKRKAGLDGPEPAGSSGAGLS